MKPLISIVCNNESLKNNFYDNGILELGFTFSANGIGSYHCKETDEESMKGEIMDYILDVETRSLGGN